MSRAHLTARLAVTATLLAEAVRTARRVLTRDIPGHAEAEDAAQQGVIDALRTWRADGGAPFVPWVHTKVRHATLVQLRRHRTEPRCDIDVADPSTVAYADTGDVWACVDHQTPRAQRTLRAALPDLAAGETKATAATAAGVSASRLSQVLADLRRCVARHQ